MRFALRLENEKSQVNSIQVLSGKESACQYKRHKFDPRLGRSPKEENGNPLQYSCLGNPMDRGAWQVTVQGCKRVEYDLATNQQQQFFSLKQGLCLLFSHPHIKSLFFCYYLPLS